MSALVVGAIAFACVFGGALFRMFLWTVLPKDHLSPDARDVIKVAMAMIATLAALVLGLLLASAKSSLDEKETELRSTARKSSYLIAQWLSMDQRPESPAIC
jgi:exosortase/archaeosortase